MKKYIQILIGLTVVIGCYAEPVISVDTEEIIALSKTAITNEYENIEVNSLEFFDLTYQLNSKGEEWIKVNFRLSCEKEDTKREKLEIGTRITTTFKTLTVLLDKDGDIRTVDEGKHNSVSISYSSGDYQKEKAKLLAEKQQGNEKK